MCVLLIGLSINKTEGGDKQIATKRGGGVTNQLLRKNLQS